MTTNIDRAADILAEAGAYCGQCCFGECGEPDCPRDADCVEYGWLFCPAGELTYIGTEPEELK